MLVVDHTVGDEEECRVQDAARACDGLWREEEEKNARMRVDESRWGLLGFGSVIIWHQHGALCEIHSSSCTVPPFGVQLRGEMRNQNNVS